MTIMAKALKGFDNDNEIPAFGFGDQQTQNKKVFSFRIDEFNNDIPCYKLEGVLNAYNFLLGQIAQKNLILSGPTSFVPIIKKAIDIVKKEFSYHILLIICDGAVTDKQSTINAIVEASNYPISIVCIGVGKGPWDIMEEFDDEINGRNFDNFQFVNFHKIMKRCENKEVEFAKHALMEIPMQYEYISKYILKYS